MNTAKYKQLKPDGAYGAWINGYDDYEVPRGKSAGSSLKKQFHNDARAVLKEVGKLLAGYGLDQANIRSNMSGVAGSGDVTAEFWSSSTPEKSIYVCIESSACNFLGGRQDGLCVMYRTHVRVAGSGRKPGWHTRHMGNNNFVSPDKNSFELAGLFLRLAGRHEQVAVLEGGKHEKDSVAVRQFTAAARSKPARVNSLQMALF